MNRLVLRNSRLHCGAAFAAGTVFAVVGLACLAALVVANVRDPKALWAGAHVKQPQAVYVVLDVLTLAWTSAMVAVAIINGKKLFDRTVQLTIDAAGIHDLRTGRKIAWSRIAGVTSRVSYTRGVERGAALNVLTKEGRTITVDIFNLDRNHKLILEEVAQMLNEAIGESQAGNTPT